MPTKWQRHLVVTILVTSNFALVSFGFDRSHVEAKPSDYKVDSYEEPLTVTQVKEEQPCAAHD